MDPSGVIDPARLGEGGGAGTEAAHPPAAVRPARFLEGGLTIWLTGLPCSGKTTLAAALVRQLRGAGLRSELLDGDELRTQLTRGLGYSPEDRAENVRRVGFVADLLSRNGIIAVCALVSPYRADRDHVRRLHGERFVEVHVSAPVHVCSQRDVKGLYAAQRAGRVVGLTGIDSSYEPPPQPEVVVPTHLQSVEQSVQAIWRSLRRRS